MKYVEEFRKKKLVSGFLSEIRKITPQRQIRIMEVCGTHTQSFFRFGLDKLLPQNIQLISGPGCPVCVSTQEYIDAAIKLAGEKNTLIATFGDMLRVPGTRSTLEKGRARLGNIAVVYSPLDALRLARNHPDKKVIFLAVGFETTAPAIALSILKAKQEKLGNISFFSSLKLIPPAMEYLLQDKALKLDAFLCPGHVSAIIGARAYEFVARQYRAPCCVTGFEPLDILEGIYLLLEQLIKARSQVDNQYARVVTKSGNRQAQKFMAQVFKISDADWRGLGTIPKSGLKIKDNFSRFNAEKVFNIKLYTLYSIHNTQCRCGDILKGLINPTACPLFAKICSPEHPVGPCMISHEGACNAYYQYRRSATT